jgi:hypothetical protein
MGIYVSIFRLWAILNKLMKFDFSVLQNNKLLKAENKLHGSESLLRGQSSLGWSRNFRTSTDSEDMFRLHNSTAGHILASWIQSIHYFRVCRAVPLPPCRRQGGGGGIAPTHYWPRHYTRVSGQRHAPAALCPREFGIHCTGGWVGHRAGVDTEDRGKALCLWRGSNPGLPVTTLTELPWFLLYCTNIVLQYVIKSPIWSHLFRFFN